MNSSSEIKVRAILETAIYADDLDRSEQFYRDALGLTLVTKQPGRHVFFSCGQAMLLIFNPNRTSLETVLVGGREVPRHGAQGVGHVAFSVDAESLPSWRDRLWRAGIKIESSVTWPHGGQSLYFRDPAGNSVELATPLVWPHLAGASLQPAENSC